MRLLEVQCPFSIFLISLTSLFHHVGDPNIADHDSARFCLVSYTENRLHFSYVSFCNMLTTVTGLSHNPATLFGKYRIITFILFYTCQIVFNSQLYLAGMDSTNLKPELKKKVMEHPLTTAILEKNLSSFVDLMTEHADSLENIKVSFPNEHEEDM